MEQTSTAAGGPPRRQPGLGAQILAAVVAACLAVVIVAPIVLSSQDLVRWAADPGGLGLPLVWAWLAFVALDAAAAVCVGMISVAAWRGEGGGLFHGLTWMFALGSAVANYRHGQTTPARDDQYFFPAMSLAGPLLLDVTLARVRRWTRLEARTQLSARPRFGLRWLPGVGFRETLRAWQTALREGIERPADAIAHVRETRALAGLDPADALGFAWQALGHRDPYVAWQWLVARGVQVDQATVREAASMAPQVTCLVTPVAPQVRGAIEGATPGAGDPPMAPPCDPDDGPRSTAGRDPHGPRVTSSDAGSHGGVTAPGLALVPGGHEGVTWPPVDPTDGPAVAPRGGPPRRGASKGATTRPRRSTVTPVTGGHESRVTWAMAQANGPATVTEIMDRWAVSASTAKRVRRDAVARAGTPPSDERSETR